LLILCSSITQLKNVIRIIKQWSLENNLKLNAKKSGILEFCPRSGPTKMNLSAGDLIEDIPVVDKYKYLGLWLNNKLTAELQIEHIEKKSNLIKSKLWGFLKHISLDYRISLWNTLIKPLFEMVIFIYYNERQSNKEKIEVLIRKIFKNITFLNKNVSTNIINKLLGFSFSNRVKDLTLMTRIKWEARLFNEVPFLNHQKQRNKPLECVIFQKNYNYS